jgi:hypothetical protein
MGRPKIQALQPYRRRRDGLFEDLTWEQQRVASQWLTKWLRKWGRNVPNWRRAILCGNARRLAKNPPTRKWGLSMQAKQGGYAVQRKYRMEGRHPTAAATEARKWKQVAAKRAKDEEERRARLGWPKPKRHRLLPLD